MSWNPFGTDDVDEIDPCSDEVLYVDDDWSDALAVDLDGIDWQELEDDDDPIRLRS